MEVNNNGIFLSSAILKKKWTHYGFHIHTASGDDDDNVHLIDTWCFTPPPPPPPPSTVNGYINK